MSAIKDDSQIFHSEPFSPEDGIFSRPLAVFMTVMEEKKFSSAAKRLGVSQSSVSQSMSSLEEKLGFELFERQRRPLAPTQEAKVLFEVIRKSHREIFELLHSARIKNGVKAPLRIGLIESVGLLTGADLCRQLKPDLGTISLFSGPSAALMKDVNEGTLDVAVVAGGDEALAPHTKKLELFDEPWVLAYPENYANKVEGLSWKELQFCGLPMIHHSADTADGRYFRKFFASVGLNYPILYEAQNNDLVLSLVEKGIGWSVTHCLALASVRKSMKIGIKEAPRGLLPRKVFLIASLRVSEKVLISIRQYLEADFREKLSCFPLSIRPVFSNR